uniref:Uncharacterized protein n=1 Tax=uncultured prokaryote TaxID=198431 RepID=A0A0H5QDN7_9ZZZZ|nr:hypothetical protein [uncultured prokaryote]
MFNFQTFLTPIERTVSVFDALTGHFVCFYSEPVSKETLDDAEEIRSFYVKAIEVALDARKAINEFQCSCAKMISKTESDV